MILTPYLEILRDLMNGQDYKLIVNNNLVLLIDKLSMDRRTFLGWVGVGTLASSLPLAMVACSNSENNGSKVNADAKAVTKDDFHMVGIASELDSNGFLLNEDITGKPIMVFRHPETNELIALNPKCPHQQCNVELDTKKTMLICPCHDSHFTLDGEVTKAPASKPLDVYQVKQEEYLIMVKVS